MSGLVDEWVEKAEGDYTTALREYRARKAPIMMQPASTPSSASKNI